MRLSSSYIKFEYFLTLFPHGGSKFVWSLENYSLFASISKSLWAIRGNERRMANAKTICTYEIGFEFDMVFAGVLFHSTFAKISLFAFMTQMTWFSIKFSAIKSLAFRLAATHAPNGTSSRWVLTNPWTHFHRCVRASRNCHSQVLLPFQAPSIKKTGRSHYGLLQKSNK